MKLCSMRERSGVPEHTCPKRETLLLSLQALRLVSLRNPTSKSLFILLTVGRDSRLAAVSETS